MHSTVKGKKKKHTVQSGFFGSHYSSAQTNGIKLQQDICCYAKKHTHMHPVEYPVK